MRKLSPIAINWIIVSIMVILLIICLISILKEKMEPGDGQIQVAEIQEKILVEIMSRNYLDNHEYLLRVEIDGEQVGIIYFDETGEIRFDGDKERFEYALYRAFKLRAYGEEEK